MNAWVDGDKSIPTIICKESILKQNGGLSKSIVHQAETQEIAVCRRAA